MDLGQDEEAKKKTYPYLDTSIMTKEALQGRRERRVFLKNGVGAIRSPNGKKNEIIALQLNITKSILEGL